MSDPCRSSSSPDPRTRRRPASCSTPSARAGARSRGSSCRRAPTSRVFERELIGDGRDAGRARHDVRRPRARDRAPRRLVGATRRRRSSASGSSRRRSRTRRSRRSPPSPRTPGFLRAALRAGRRAGALADHAAALHRRRARVAAGAAAPRTRPPRSTTATRARSSGCDRVDAELFAWRALDALRAQPRRLGRDARLLLRLRRPHAAGARRGRDARARRRRGGDRLAHVRARPHRLRRPRGDARRRSWASSRPR